MDDEVEYARAQLAKLSAKVEEFEDEMGKDHNEIMRQIYEENRLMFGKKH